MTTPVNSFQDILDALEKDTALRDQLRNYVLPDEVRELPAQFVLLMADVDELKKGQARLEEGQARLRADIDELKKSQARLEEGQARLWAAVDGLKEGQARLEEGQARLEEGQGRLEVRMDRVEGRFGNVEGRLYEQRSVNRVLARAARLNIEPAQIAFSPAGPARQEFYDAMTVAIRGGLISQDEYEDLTEADLILRGGNHLHAVVEISLGPDEDDLSRAVRRSEILRRATGDQVTPVIATPNPHPALIQEAERRNISVLDVPA